MKRTRRLLSLMVCIILMAGMGLSSAERDPWDCPNCGRKGNTGNFCGSCGQPAAEATPEPTAAPVWSVLYRIFYADEEGNFLNNETITLSGSGTITYTILANDPLVPAGYVLAGESRAKVTIRNGEPEPERVTFVYRNMATPTPSPTPTPTPEPTMGPVTGMQVQSITVNTIVVTWNSAREAEAYRVEVLESGGSWRSEEVTKGSMAKIGGLKAGTEYEVRITAVSGGKEGAPAVISARTNAATPTPRPTPKVQAGDYVTFGHYEQDNNTANGQEAIEWLVLEVKGGKALLLSRYGLDAKAYNTEKTAVTWETSSLRKWLNGEFKESAFSSAEQGSIEETEVDNSAVQSYSGWSTSGGKNTRDKVYLLSYGEAHKYFGVEYWEVTGSGDNMKSRTSATAYAKAQGAWTSDTMKTAEGENACRWWLRSPGRLQYYAAGVSTGGSLSDNNVNIASVCVRPALWVNLESGIF